MATLEVRDLTKRYGTDEVAVDGVDLAVGDGELFVILGPSGCGKSTLLRMIAGLEPLTTGQVLIGGVDASPLAPRDRDIAMTFQGGALYPNMSVRDNIGFSLRVGGVDEREIERRVVEVAHVLHLADVLDESPQRLSGGQRQRVAMGRAIIRHPQLFLMDEPLSSLDTKLRIETRAFIVRMQRRLGVTTVYVTHDQAEAMGMADRVAVMRRGRVVQVGTPMDLYLHPSDLFVATFMGSPPMSVVLASACVRNGEAVLWIGRQWLPWADLFDRFPWLAGDRRVDVALGVRQEALALDAAGPLAVNVAAIEDLGHERLLHTTLVAAPVRSAHAGVVVADEAVAVLHVTARTEVPIDLWKPVRLAVDTGLLHLFDLTTGEAMAPVERASAPCG